MLKPYESRGHFCWKRFLTTDDNQDAQPAEQTSFGTLTAQEQLKAQAFCIPALIVISSAMQWGKQLPGRI